MSDAPFSDDQTSEPALTVEVDGFEGPLDLLLELARQQKVDLQKISILALAEQYLAFIEAARARLELAADYLVMAAWLAFLKSRLLLPKPKISQEPDAAELAAALADRLRRLAFIRAAAGALDARPQLARDFVLRGIGEAHEPSDGKPVWQATVYDLLTAFVRQQRRRTTAHVRVPQRTVCSLNEARTILRQLVGTAHDWSCLDDHLLMFCLTPDQRTTMRASAFSVALEMVRKGEILLKQDRPFAPLWLRNKTVADPHGHEDGSIAHAASA